MPLINRSYKPSSDEVIYHYCTPDAFFGITQNKRLWLSDVFAMNDFMEMHWGYSIFERAATELLKTIPREFFDEVDKYISSSGAHVLPLIACFSMDGDVLSQWRAYSSDGEGFAIGFAASEIVQMAVRPLRVLYDEQQQIKEVKTILLALHEVEKSEGFKYGKDFAKSCIHLALDLCALKNPAFQEEKEIRIAHAINFIHSTNGMHLESAGGTAWARDAAPEKIYFRMKQEIPVSYVSMDFTNGGRICPIKKIVLGPKNKNLLSNIRVYLNTNGVTNVAVQKSSASYV